MGVGNGQKKLRKNEDDKAFTIPWPGRCLAGPCALTQREGRCGRKEKRWESRREAGRKPSAGEESTEGTAALHRNTPPCSHTNHYFSVYRRGESLAEKSTREGNSQFRYVARHASPFQCLLSASLPSLRPAADLATGAEGKGGAATCPASSVTTFDTQDRTGGTEVSPQSPTHLPGIPGFSVCVKSLPANEWKKEESVLPGWQCLLSGLFRLYCTQESVGCGPC